MRQLNHHYSYYCFIGIIIRVIVMINTATDLFFSYLTHFTFSVSVLALCNIFSTIFSGLYSDIHCRYYLVAVIVIIAIIIRLTIIIILIV